MQDPNRIEIPIDGVTNDEPQAFQNLVLQPADEQVEQHATAAAVRALELARAGKLRPAACLSESYWERWKARAIHAPVDDAPAPRDAERIQAAMAKRARRAARG
jgi:hypothetical protein